MSQGTTFRIIAFDSDNKLSKDEIMKMAVIDRYRSVAWGAKKSEEETVKDVEKIGMAPFLPILAEQNEEDKQYNQYRQKEEPFPLWIDTKSSFVGHELMAHDFTSDFDKLYEHFNLQPEGPRECIEIPRNDVVKMMQVLDYIKKGKYDKDIEETFFSDNEYFRVFENQFYNFSIRFRKNRKEKENGQTVTIVIRDERDEDRKNPYIVTQEENYDYEAEEDESRRDEIATVDYLRSILSAFLLMEPRYAYRSHLEYKLVYHKWI